MDRFSGGGNEVLIAGLLDAHGSCRLQAQQSCDRLDITEIELAAEATANVWRFYDSYLALRQIQHEGEFFPQTKHMLWRPLRRILKTALIGTCAPAARFDMLSLYSSMALEHPRLNRFLGRIDGAVLKIIHSAPARSQPSGG